jgi:hypothetical protein
MGKAGSSITPASYFHFQMIGTRYVYTLNNYVDADLQRLRDLAPSCRYSSYLDRLYDSIEQSVPSEIVVISNLPVGTHVKLRTIARKMVTTRSSELARARKAKPTVSRSSKSGLLPNPSSQRAHALPSSSQESSSSMDDAWNGSISYTPRVLKFEESIESISVDSQMDLTSPQTIEQLRSSWMNEEVRESRGSSKSSCPSTQKELKCFQSAKEMISPMPSMNGSQSSYLTYPGLNPSSYSIQSWNS